MAKIKLLTKSSDLYNSVKGKQAIPPIKGKRDKPYKNTGCLSLKDNYGFYQKRTAKMDPNRVVNFNSFRQIYNEVAKHIVMYLLQGKEVRLGSNVGSFKAVRKKMKPSKGKVDFGVYRSEGIKVPYLNMHTNGYYVRLAWKKSAGMPIKNLDITQFTPAKYTLARALSKVMSDTSRGFEFDKG